MVYERLANKTSDNATFFWEKAQGIVCMDRSSTDRAAKPAPAGVLSRERGQRLLITSKFCLELRVGEPACP